MKRKAFMCSLCWHGLLGGGLYLDDEAVTYICQKITVDKNHKKIVMPLNEIDTLSWKWIVFPVATIRMKDGETHRFLIFNYWRFNNAFPAVQ